MPRVFFESVSFSKWLGHIFDKNSDPVAELSHIASVSERTIRDWKRGKFTVRLDALEKISRHYNLEIPEKIKVVDDYWYGIKGAHMGGLARLKKHGPPGTQFGRAKGGLISQKNRRLHPEKYPNCKLAKTYPKQRRDKTTAELIGIILGDGSLTNSQMRITLSSEKEMDYVKYISELIEKLFREFPTVNKRNDSNTVTVMMTGINFIKEINRLGLLFHNKVVEQVGVPSWIKMDLKFSTACLRGLLDTDGCVFFHRHKVGRKEYQNLGINFSNHSVPLVDFVIETLKKNNFSPRRGAHGVYLYREDEVLEYARRIGFRNSHHFNRLAELINRKGVRVV